MKFKLLRLDVPPHESELLLESASPITLGRDHPDVDVQINDNWVSRLQCVIEEIEGTLRVRDLGSRHGTFVNELQIQEMPLRSGDRLSVGVSTFEVQFPVPAEQQAAQADSHAAAPR
jgi:pSer/pThr/pTyr-binding forkhead associated (FHA) protein